MEEKKMTGYPSVDKPWLKYYDKKAVSMSLPEGSMYQFLYNANKDYMDRVAMIYLNQKITYQKMFDNIDRLAECFAAKGIGRGDIVTIISLNTPETYYIFYALNKIGAIACMESVTQPSAVLLESFRNTMPKLIVILNVFVEAFKDALIDFGGNIVVISPVESVANLIANILNKKLGIFKMIPKELAQSYSKFNNGAISKCKLCTKSNATAVLIPTSGSTGKPKKVALTNKNINSIAFQYKVSGMRLGRGDTFIAMAPPFHAFGLSLFCHTPLCQGVILIVSTDPGAQKCAKLFARYNPNLFLGSVEHAMAIMNNKKVQKLDLSNLYMMAIGGESVSDVVRDKANEFLKLHNAKINLIVGYGMSELSATAITEMSSVWKYGSVGIPQIMTNVRIIDVESGKELKYEEIGEIMISSPGIMKEYVDNREETEKTRILDKNGVIWLHTGDLGYIDEDGLVFIKGRIKRIFWTRDISTGHIFKLFPDYIQEELDKLDLIKRSAVIVKPDEDRVNVAVAFIVVKESNADAEKEIVSCLKERIPEYDMPSRYVFTDTIPLLPNGKIDYKKLEEIEIR